jgi:hypothetical protein
MLSFKQFLIETSQGSSVPLVLDDPDFSKVSSNKGNWAKKFIKSNVADLAGSLIGNYVVKPTAEKIGFFEPFESGGTVHKILSNSPEWVTNTTEKALDLTQTGLGLVLDPIQTAGNFIAKKIEDSGNKKLQSIRHTDPASKSDYEKAAKEAEQRRKARGIKTPEELSTEQSSNPEPYRMRAG